MNTEFYINRLVDEWKKHGKIIVAVDYDDTIFPYRDQTTEHCKEVINLLRWVQSIGCYTVIFTASDVDRFEEIDKYCSDHGINIDAINQNPIDLPYGHNGKIYYNIFLCDRAGLSSAMEILEKSAEQYLTYTQQNTKLDEIN